MNLVTIPNTPMPQEKLNTVLTVAGSDSSGGAGIEADLKTFTAHKCYGMTCITALTAQNTLGVKEIVFTEKQMMCDLLDAIFEDVHVDVIKTGLLTVDAIEVLSEKVESSHKGKPLVVDPVMVATTGAQLSGEDVLRRGVEMLFPKTTLVTPNLPETQSILKLFGLEVNVESKDDLARAAKLLHEKTGARNVLVKGGHTPWIVDGKEILTDVLYLSSNDTLTVFESESIKTENTHGTGCTLASAISANLANGHDLLSAVESGINYVHKAIVSVSKIGHGNGPLNHMYHIASASTVNTEPTPFTEGHFVDFVLTHPLVQPVWTQYITHPFVSKIADGSLHFDKFLHFISQDYPYLVNYARVHSIALSVAPDVQCIDREIVILNEIRHEMSEHTKRLAGHGIVDVETMQLNGSCKRYCEYLMDVAKRGDWLEINVALAPCLLGYHEAAKHVQAKEGIKVEYKEWLDAYVSDWYKNAVQLGRETLERHGAGIDLSEALKLVKIFADVCQLEVDFWTEAMNFEA